ncbi:DMT family transporter [Phaeobacter gallaeciensis]|uniref:EamA-like transporter family protein n=1 Tax=Phaeobacter gallaeciensis TaxID=60890 RepID=A0AAD0EEX7_9RHOB|nr:DMT family transporter [Phaeobacter gallaeciensis]AHD11824.1 EamA-like transporter family [Phaeobacter gallaeciensis DSM 26640]ATE95088.1 EamA-like transporter family protein [Phaeobacter gallaeciensis]ATE99396.1 EamA-like transporter family protein [Phaeobacter gallaeciensis]ATF03792.1 EamA-like transporter family protein [Phaeobacter gallaeciensis]ATF07985.1 EamA-like transporter family protein [Phaeobacter gallaeciensis]
MGELFALLSAACYGMAGVTIARSRSQRRGDGGVFLSVLMTALLTGALWLLAGPEPALQSSVPNKQALTLFALAGVFATVLGRLFMYRSTEILGPVCAAMLRRLIPFFAIPLAILMIGDWPAPAELVGGVLVVAGVFAFVGGAAPLGTPAGVLLGLLSAASYALSYSLRKLGLLQLPDPLLATCVGAVAGCLCYVGWALSSGSKDKGRRLHGLLVDCGPGFLGTGLLLSAGQTLQLAALLHTSVTSVALIGALDVLFSALFAALLLRQRLRPTPRGVMATLFVGLGSALLLLN